MSSNEFYRDDGSPIKCAKCGSSDIQSNTTSTLAVLDNGDGPVLEYECRCGACNELVGYWAYGWFDPIFKSRLEVDEL